MKKRSLFITVFSTIAVLIIISVLLIFYLNGVIFIKDKKITNFKDFKKLESIPTSIEVTFNDEYVGTFMITDEDKIKEIHDLLIARVYIKGENPPAPGTSRTMKFIYSDGTTITLGTRAVKINDKYYMPEKSDSLDYLLQTIGLALGKLSER